MGYTNYFYVKKEVKELPKEFLDDCEKVVREWNKQHGCSAKITIECSPTDLIIDADSCCCENMVITTNPDSRFIQRDRDGSLFNFTKTRRYAYDSAIKAICMLGVTHGVISKWSFDGTTDEKEYADAVELMKACGFEPEPPREEEDDV